MGYPYTDPAFFEDIVTIANAMGTLALRLPKEQPGYILI